MSLHVHVYSQYIQAVLRGESILSLIHANLQFFLVTVDTALTQSEVSDASSFEECPSQTQQSISFPVPSEDLSASLLDIGVLINSGTLRSVDKYMKLKLIQQTPDSKFTYPTKLCMVATDSSNLRGPKPIHGYITVHLMMVCTARLVSCSLLLMLNGKD